jgi:hypothetical protein
MSDVFTIYYHQRLGQGAVSLPQMFINLLADHNIVNVVASPKNEAPAITS